MSARFTTLSLVVLAVLCVVNISSAATLRERSVYAGEKTRAGFVGRQQYSSEEGSDEDSEESDAEQAAHQAYLQSQRNPEDSFEESGEDNDDFEDDYDGDSRKRREVISTAEQVTPAEVVTQAAIPATEDSIKTEEETVTPAVAVTPVAPTVSAAAPPKKSSVLILIRDTLKKVTNDLPTQQYATNALQYFQLFEHFLQETIEDVINGDDDDEEEEASTDKIQVNVTVEQETVTKAPETEAVEVIANVAVVPEEQKKPMETVETVAAPQAETSVPAVAESAVSTPAVVEPSVAEPAKAEPAVAEPAVAEPAVAAAIESIPTKITFV